MDFSDRLQQLTEYLNITAYRMSKDIGTSEAVISNVRSGRNKPSYDLISKILNKYKVVSAEWLLTGEGPMLKNEGNTSNTPTLEEHVYNYARPKKANSPPPIPPISSKNYTQKLDPTLDPTPKKCRICEEKERVIAQQSEVIQALKKVVAQMEMRLQDYDVSRKKNAG